MEEAFERALAYVRDGGAVMWPLAGAAALVWYAIGYRLFALRPGLVAEARRRAEDVPGDDDVDVMKARVALVLAPVEDRLGRFRVVLAALVVAAPLLGLLGTVMGMMETFGSLGDGALYVSGGGIAAGVSEALITTQMGLAVAIPGLLVGRALARREARLREVLAGVQHEAIAHHLQTRAAEATA